MWRPAATLLVLAALGSRPDAQGSDNLVPNGSFDKPGAAVGELPAGWRMERRDAALSKSFQLSDDRPFDAARCLKLAREDSPAVLVTDAPIPIQPQATYRLRHHFRVEKSNLEGGQAMYVRVRYYDAEAKPLDWRTYGTISLNTGGWARPSPDWMLREIDFTTPPSAQSIDVSIGPGGGWKGVVAVDGVSIRRIAKAAFEPPPGSRAFQFAAATDEAVPGFTAVPPDRSFEAQGDFGWKLRPGTELGTSRVANQPEYPTRLEAHGVRNATFSCSLPDGRYSCSIYMGALWRTSIEAMNHVVLANGRTVVEDVRDFNRLMDEEYFRYVHATLVTPDDVARKGLAVYDKYIRPRYRRHDFTAEVTGGRLDLAIQQGFASALVITPAADEKEHLRRIEALDRALAEEFADTWAELLPDDSLRPAVRGDYHPTAEDRGRGYVVFHRHWMDAVEYDSRPEPGDVGTQLALFATPGEYEPVTFSVWPLEDLKSVRVTVGALIGPGGAALSPDAVRVWYLQQKQERRPRPSTGYRIRGTFLPDWQVRDLFPDITQRCWLNVHVPSGARPGVYRGQIELHPENAPPTTLRLALRVLPFTLKRPERIHVMRRAANQVLVPYPARYPVGPDDVRNKQFYRKEAIDDLFAHGFSPELAIWWTGVYSRQTGRIDWERANSLSGPAGQFLQLVKDSPFGRGQTLWVDACSMNNFGLLDAFGQGSPQWSVEDTGRWLEAISRKLAAAGFSKVYLQASAEESHLPPKAGVDGWTGYLRYVRQNRQRWPNIYTAHTANTAWGQKIALAECDLVGLGMFHGVRENAAEQVDEARATGHPFLLYGVRGRMVPGFYLWKAGAVGTFHEFYAPYFGTPNNDWDNDLGMDNNARQVLNEAPGWSNAVYSPTGRMIGSWFWEEMREGVDDDAYLHTLQEWIRLAAADSSPKVAAARRKAIESLQEIADQIDLDVGQIQGGRGLALYRPFPPKQFDALRWKAAEATIELKSAVEGATGYPATTQDLLPAAGQALPDGLSTRRVPAKGLKAASLHLLLLSQARLAQSHRPGCDGATRDR